MKITVRLGDMRLVDMRLGDMRLVDMRQGDMRREIHYCQFTFKIMNEE